MSGNRNLQRQSVVTVLVDKPHFVKVINSQLFKKMTIDTFMEDTNDNERKMSDKNATREEFKHTKLENKSFVQGQK